MSLTWNETLLPFFGIMKQLYFPFHCNRNQHLADGCIIVINFSTQTTPFPHDRRNPHDDYFYDWLPFTVGLNCYLCFLLNDVTHMGKASGTECNKTTLICVNWAVINPFHPQTSQTKQPRSLNLQTSMPMPQERLRWCVFRIPFVFQLPKRPFSSCRVVLFFTASW